MGMYKLEIVKERALRVEEMLVCLNPNLKFPKPCTETILKPKT